LKFFSSAKKSTHFFLSSGQLYVSAQAKVAPIVSADTSSIPQLPGTQELQAVQRIAVGRGEQILKLLRWSWSVPGEQARNASVYVEQARRWCSPRPSWTKLNHAPRSATPSPTGNCRQGPTRTICTASWCAQDRAKLIRCLPFIILQLSY
jgi:hypothetical protein